MVLLAGIQAQHVLSQDGAAMKEVGQRDVDGCSCQIAQIKGQLDMRSCSGEW